jgi:hypothetical protein
MMIVSGRLRDLADKLLFGQAYPLHIEVTDPGRESIRITVDGDLVLEEDRLIVDWAFDPRLPSLEPGPHQITVTDETHAVTWTVIKSRFTHLTEDEIFQDSIDVRETYGLNTDPAYVHEIMHDPALELNLECLMLPMTDDELAVVDSFEDPGQPWGEMVVGRRESEPPPALPATDPVDRYCEIDAADVYAGCYIDRGKLILGFTRDADKHLEELRRRTDMPLDSFQATYSLAYLRDVQQRIVEDWEELRTLGIYLTMMRPDIRDNIVEVGTKPLEGSQRRLLFDRYGPAIRVVTTVG